MWSRIEIRNYRSIEHASVELAPFTVVVGPNGSGKSNFVDAFVFARDIANDASTAVQSRGGIAGVRRRTDQALADVTIDIRMANTRAELETEYFRHSFTLSSEHQKEWEFKREIIEEARQGHPLRQVIREGQKILYDGETFTGMVPPETTSFIVVMRQRLPTYPGEDPRGLNPIRRYRLNPDLMRQPQLVTERQELDESGANIARVISSIQAKSEWEPILMAMRKLVPGLVDIRQGALGRYLGIQFFQKQAGGGATEFAATEMSEGAIRALGILAAAQQQSEHRLLIIEEPEVSIHPGAAAVLFESLKASSRRGAVLLTTHSAELVDAAKDEEILVCEYRDGVTNVGPMDPEQRKLVKEGLLSAAELMRSEPLRIEGMPPVVIPHEEAQ